ncbi:hypothetical protein LIER_32720 [Lithospermum erythrorhizon]|uniref:Uncharacterized protein n=1 Tax=Lithospermum erythrorhizon TaxID=34254 RepID=A0AAV3RYP1_LITER
MISFKATIIIARTYSFQNDWSKVFFKKGNPDHEAFVGKPQRLPCSEVFFRSCIIRGLFCSKKNCFSNANPSIGITPDDNSKWIIYLD